MIDEKRQGQLERALAETGGTHDLGDIMKGITSGEFQSFARGETWAVTSIIETPRKRICEVFLVVGDMSDAIVLHDEVEMFARARGCKMLRTIARSGWLKWAKPRGWTTKHSVYLKEL
jgi:hypothetical protein